MYSQFRVEPTIGGKTVYKVYGSIGEYIGDLKYFDVYGNYNYVHIGNYALKEETLRNIADSLALLNK